MKCCTIMSWLVDSKFNSPVNTIKAMSSQLSWAEFLITRHILKGIYTGQVKAVTDLTGWKVHKDHAVLMLQNADFSQNMLQTILILGVLRKRSSWVQMRCKLWWTFWRTFIISAQKHVLCILMGITLAICFGAKIISWMIYSLSPDKKGYPHNTFQLKKGFIRNYTLSWVMDLYQDMLILHRSREDMFYIQAGPIEKWLWDLTKYNWTSMAWTSLGP